MGEPIFYQLIEPVEYEDIQPHSRTFLTMVFRRVLPDLENLVDDMELFIAGMNLIKWGHLKIEIFEDSPNNIRIRPTLLRETTLH